MSGPVESMLGSTTRPLPLRLRSDLVVSRETRDGRQWALVKDPLGLHYFRLAEEEFALLNWLDGRASLADIKQRYDKQFAPREIRYDELNQLIASFYRGGLVVSNATGQGDELVDRQQKRRRQELLSRCTSILSIRFRGIDPEPLLRRLAPWTTWIFSAPAVLVGAAFIMAAIAWVAVHWSVVQSRLPSYEQFFTPTTVLLLLAVLGMTKVLHEFGHALALKRFGGECHELGVMLLVFTPCLYCNVSDAWMLPSKWRRAAVGAAGIYVELILASLATFVWFSTGPGLLNTLCLSTMIVSSVSTIVFNGNPLLRYDGYYILSDLTGVPNLAQKSAAVVQRCASAWLLGLDSPPDVTLPARGHGWLAAYAVASAVYRWIVLLSILLFVNALFKQHQVQVVGRIIGFVAVGGLVVRPLWKLGQFLRIPGRADAVRRARASVALAGVVALVAALVFIPLPRRVQATLELTPRDAARVYVDVPGQLQTVLVRAGEVVSAGQPLARLENLDLQVDVARLEADCAQCRIRLANLRRQRHGDASAALELRQVEESLASAVEQLTRKQADLARLELRAPLAGTILAAPDAPPTPAPPGMLSGWSGDPLDSKNLGTTFEESTLVCQVGDPGRWQALLIVDQADVPFVAAGQSVELCLDSQPLRPVRSTVAEVARSDLSVSPRRLSNKAGGELATRTDAAGIERPLSTSYQVRVPLDESIALAAAQSLADSPVGGSSYVDGLRGTALIEVSPEPLARRAFRWFSRTFHFRLQ